MANGRGKSQSFWCSETIFARTLFTVRWNLSTWFVKALYGVVRSFLIPKSLQTSFMVRLFAPFPWSLKIDNGVPKPVNTCTTIGHCLDLLASERKCLSPLCVRIHDVRIQICPLSLFGRGPVKSIYHRSYGAPATTDFNGFCFVSFFR